MWLYHRKAFRALDLGYDHRPGFRQNFACEENENLVITDISLVIYDAKPVGVTVVCDAAIVSVSLKRLVISRYTWELSFGMVIRKRPSSHQPFPSLRSRGLG
jgi:hypothetical protein